MGLFGSLVVVGYFDHAPLAYHWPGADVLWRPIVVTPLFVLCYLAFFAAHLWYARNPPAPDLPEEPAGAGVWIPLGAGLAALVLAGSLLGLAACAAGLALSCWLAVYVRAIGPVWRPYRTWAKLLFVSALVPPALGWPMPNFFAALFLAPLSATMLTGMLIDGGQYYLLVRDARNATGGTQ